MTKRQSDKVTAEVRNYAASLHNRLYYLRNSKPRGYSDDFYTPDALVASSSTGSPRMTMGSYC